MIKFRHILNNVMKTIRIEIVNSRLDVVSIAISLLIHSGILFSILILLNASDKSARVNPPFVQVTTQDLTAGNLREAGNKYNPGNNTKSEKIKNVNEGHDRYTFSEKESHANAAFYSFSNIKADTSGLDQIYKESTLDVTIKYPAGWTYVDQDIKNKLDGVTFWSNLGNYSPPPYVHLEVKDKDLFSQVRYKYKSKMNGYTVYYNNPEKLEDQIMQTFYIRTNSDQDFSLELIMEGEEAFKSFQPVFFGMIKSFKFGHSLF